MEERKKKFSKKASEVQELIIESYRAHLLDMGETSQYNAYASSILAGCLGALESILLGMCRTDKRSGMTFGTEASASMLVELKWGMEELLHKVRMEDPEKFGPLYNKYQKALDIAMTAYPEFKRGGA